MNIFKQRGYCLIQHSKGRKGKDGRRKTIVKYIGKNGEPTASSETLETYTNAKRNIIGTLKIFGGTSVIVKDDVRAQAYEIFVDGTKKEFKEYQTSG